MNAEEWPIEWKTTYYKTYPRMAKVPLLDDTPSSADFYTVLRTRTSKRDFDRRQLSFAEVSTLLKYSCGIVQTEPKAHRAQPSGGGRFAVEMYALVFAGSKELPAGVYHYNVKEHALEVLWERPFADEDIAQLCTYPWMKQASMLLVMTAVFQRNQMKYGDRGYRYMLTEAGHIGQNVYLNASALGLKCCALGGTYDTKLEELLDIDGIHESVVYTVALG